jgi:hypothetical protein
MAWRPTEYLLEGVLDNTTPGKVTGWMRFAGMKDKVTFGLEGDFHRDIRGAKIHLIGEGREDDPEAAHYFEGFAQHQKGKVGDITAGLPPQDYVSYPHIEWYGDDNGRVVIELNPDQVRVIGKPILAAESEPVSRKDQQRNMEQFLAEVAQRLDLPPQRVECTGGECPSQPANSAHSDPRPRQKLLTQEIRKKLPPLGSQDGLGGRAVAHVKFFTPDSHWTWWATEFDGNDTFFGLVEGFEKELGYFSLAELQAVRGPMGLSVERDIHWKPRSLEDIAPEMFARHAAGRSEP